MRLRAGLLAILVLTLSMRVVEEMSGSALSFNRQSGS